jgi:pimeloyl-ACP methyl ester carboxylesterase
MRQQLPNARSFIELSTGTCHYSVEGPATGRTLVLIHGATVPLWQFDRLVPILNRQGIRTIRLDLFGHGYSDRPNAEHDCILFTRQVVELLDGLGVGEGVDLLGHSLGCAVAARLMLADPGRFNSLVMIAPVLNFLQANPAAKLLRVPLFGELLVAIYVVPMLLRRRTRRYRDIQDGRFVQMFRDQLRVPGFGRSLLSLLRGDALGDQRTCYAALNPLDNAVLVVSAAGDQIAIPAHMDILRGQLPNAEFCEIEDAEHALILTHPEPVAAHIMRHLSRQVNSSKAATSDAAC